MNSLPMLVSLIETAIKEKTIDKMYDDFLEEILKMGLSSYTLNTLIVNAKKRLEYDEASSDDDSISPFIYRLDIIKPEPENKIQEKIIIKNKKGFGFIISALLILLINIGIIALFCQNTIRESNNVEKSLASVESKIKEIKLIANIGDSPIKSFDSWESTNHKDNSKSNKDYSFEVKSGDRISFKYDVSSEFSYDKLNVYLYTPSDTTILMTESGLAHGTKTHSFNQDGNVTIRFEYSKDSSYRKNEDVVKISNIKIYRPYYVQMNEIKKILSIEKAND